MDDFIPFLIFVIIGVINFAQFAAKKKKLAQQKGESEPAVSPLAQIFERLSEELAPKVSVVEEEEWPENFQRPDYAHEMEEFLHTKEESVVEQKETLESLNEKDDFIPNDIFEIPEHRPSKRSKTVFSSSHGLRMISATKKGNGSAFRIGGKKELRQALKAHIIFSPPRAMDPSFDDRIIK